MAIARVTDLANGVFESRLLPKRVWAASSHRNSYRDGVDTLGRDGKEIRKNMKLIAKLCSLRIFIETRGSAGIR